MKKELQTTELQSNLLSANTIKKVMPSCMVYALVQSLTFMVDTIVAGHFLGTDAVAAVALGIPIIGLMLSFAAMIMQGGFLKLLVSMGRSDMKDYQRIFSITIAFTFFVDFIFLVICLFGTKGVMGIAGAAKATGQAQIMGQLYIRTACLMILFFCMGSIYQIVMATYGYQTERMMCSIICVAVNVVTSMIFIIILPEAYRIVGLGVGSSLGALAQMISARVMMARRHIIVKFRLYPLNKKNILDALDMLRRGLPSSIDTMLDSASGSIVNRVILSSFADGTGVLALVAVLKTLSSVVRTVGRGAFYASEPLIGILYGGRDNEGIKKAFLATIRISLVYAIGMGVILILIKNPLLTFYHVNDKADAHMGVLMLALGGIVAIFPFVLNAVYESTGHLMFSLLVATVPDSILYPLLIPVLSKAFGVTGVWLAMSFNFIPFFIVFYLLHVLANKGSFLVPLEKLLRLKQYSERTVALDVSIPAKAEDISFVSESLQNFFLEHGASRKVAYYVALCTEEIAAEYLEYRKVTKTDPSKAYMDIKAFRDVDQVEIILRNYDEPYNPLVFEREEESFRKIGVTMVQRIARDINYSYTYHLNMVSVIIDA